MRKGVYEESVDASGREWTEHVPEIVDSDKAGKRAKASKETLLHIAASLKDLDLVTWLIDHSALIILVSHPLRQVY